MEDRAAPPELHGAETTPKFPPPKSSSSFNHRIHEGEPNRLWNGDYGFGGTDRRFAFSRNASFRQSDSRTPGSMQRSNSFRPNLLRSDSSISIRSCEGEEFWRGYEKPSLGGEVDGEKQKVSGFRLIVSVIRAIRFGNRPMKRLALMISLNVAYSTTELMIGLFTGRVGLVSDAFHLTFGCGLLTFSLLAMAVSRKKRDGVYTYGYQRLEVLAAFTNARVRNRSIEEILEHFAEKDAWQYLLKVSALLFLLFMSFSIAVEALHAFIQDESEHKHYLVVSAVTNLLVNLLGVWFFRSYARVNIVYRKAEDMNYHSVCLHVLADSIRSAGLILASWFLSLGVENAEVLCLGLVSVVVLMVILPLFRATGSILLQMAPANVPSSALTKCCRQVSALEDVSEVSQARFWELVPGHAIGSLSIQVKQGANDYPILQYVHGLYHDLGIQDLTVQTDYL